jgi:hypothetical protein
MRNALTRPAVLLVAFAAGASPARAADPAPAGAANPAPAPAATSPSTVDPYPDVAPNPDALAGIGGVPPPPAPTPNEATPQPNPGALAGIGTAPEPNAGALDFARADVLTLELGAGSVGSFDTDQASVDFHGALIGAATAWLGFRAHALRFDVNGRPELHDTVVSGTLASVDAWMIGAGYTDSSPCFFWFGVLCDGTTGFVGLGGTLVGFQHDTLGPRTALRIGELDVIGSVTPAFAAGWSKYRFLPKVGASLDHFWSPPGLSDRFVGRLAVGFDAAARLGPLDVEPTFRWRPSFSGFTDDYGFEAALEAAVRDTWKGLDHAGDALKYAVQLGYSYWSIPALSYGPDFGLGGQHTVFIRLVMAPSLFSAVRPAGI